VQHYHSSGVPSASVIPLAERSGLHDSLRGVGQPDSPAEWAAPRRRGAGRATAAAEADVSKRTIMAQTGYKSLPTVRRYIREGSLFKRNAAAVVGL